jgi:hypothetical protein
VFTLRRLGIGLTSVVIPSLFAFVAAGHFGAASNAFAWDIAAVAGTGAATASLAVWTAALALSTADDVSSTRELARIERARFDKEDEPLVLLGLVVMDFTEDIGLARQRVSATLVNAGRGPARAVKWEAYFRADAGTSEIRSVDPLSTDRPLRGAAGVMTPNGTYEVRFDPWVLHEMSGRYGLRGTYRDRKGDAVILYGREPLEGWPRWQADRERDLLVEPDHGRVNRRGQGVDHPAGSVA